MFSNAMHIHGYLNFLIERSEGAVSFLSTKIQCAIGSIEFTNSTALRPIYSKLSLIFHNPVSGWILTPYPMTHMGASGSL